MIEKRRRQLKWSLLSNSWSWKCDWLKMVGAQGENEETLLRLTWGKFTIAKWLRNFFIKVTGRLLDDYCFVPIGY